MPFTRVSIAPSTNPKVTVRFSGLMLLKSDDGRTCQVGINRFSSIHSFQVMLVISRPDRPPAVVRLLNGPLSREFLISVTPTPAAGFQVFGRPGVFNRSDPANDPLDHRWALNFRIPHPGADFNDGARPIARLNAGVLYSSSLTAPGADPVLICGTSTTPMVRIAGDLAASIELAAGSVVRLDWDEFGEPRNFVLPRRRDPLTPTYTLVLLNEPLTINPPSHDELPLYYRVLQVGGAVPTPRCRLIFNGDPGTDEIPCMPGILNP